MIVRSELIREIGGFLPDLGMAGEKIAFGEEIQLQKDLRARYADLVVIYSPSLRLYHLVRSEKFRLMDAAYRAFVSGKYYFYIHPQSDSLYRTCRHLLRLVAEVILDLAVRAWTRSRLRFPSTQNYIYERTVQNIFNIGYTYEMLLTKSGPGK
jgi:GT2 family glycosyltransferase